MRTDLKCLFLPAPVATIETVWRNFRSEELAAAAEAGLVRQRKVRRSGIVSVTPAEGGCYLVAATEKDTLAPDIGRFWRGERRLTESELQRFCDEVLLQAR
jgi:hypothetical protein